MDSSQSPKHILDASEVPNPNLAPSSLLDRMKQRTEDIAQRAEHRRQIKESKAAASESVDYFHRTFSEMRSAIETKVEHAENVDKAELINYLDEMVKDLQKMQQLLNESSMFLASFQIKTAQEELKDLNTLVHKKIDALQPKKKFGFGSKRGAAEKINKTNEEVNTDTIDTSHKQVTKDRILDDLIEKQFFGFKDETNTTLTKSPQELEDRQLNLYNLRDCQVVALGNPSTLQVASLHNCTVIVGPTSRSAFIKDCTDCKFIMACQQVRIHNTTNTQFYLHVTGSAIIENSHELQVAPYNLEYPDLKEDFRRSGLDPDTNYWDKIEDFHWLNENENSPNWVIIPEADRSKDWLH